MESSGNIEELLRSVDDLCSYQFFIPHYQRGYRWTEDQVNALLKDINNFQSKDKAFYCLQPLVIKARLEENNQWDVIDGQQRLTTIYLILTFFAKEGLLSTIFNITYEKWENSGNFLKNISNKNCDNAAEYIDYFLMFKAFNAIEKFFKNYSAKEKKDFLENLKKETKFIWHDVSEQVSAGSNVSAESIFLNFNIGKIQLTDLELTKALFLRKYDNTKNYLDWKIAQQKIADEWNNFDRIFNNDDFLAFLGISDNKHYRSQSKLLFLFDLVVFKSEKNYKEIHALYDRYRIFHYFEVKLNNSNDVEKKWNNIKSLFVILHEWYANPNMNKFVGYYFYLLWKDGTELNKKFEKIESLIDCYEKVKSKDEFIKNNINGLIKNNISTLFDKIFGEALGKDKSMYFSNLGYGDYHSNRLIKNLLVLLDVLSFHDDELYPFKRLDQVDIEHIHALGLGDDSNENITQDAIDLIRNALSKVHNDKFDEVLNKNNFTIDELKKLSDEVSDELGLNGIDNLTLLPESVNRKIKNAKFADKRKAVITLLKENTYIHRSAQRVFMKFYSEKSDLDTWDVNERQDYLNGLKKTLSYYIEGFYTLDTLKEQQANEKQ